jgi:hypothetical protein
MSIRRMISMGTVQRRCIVCGYPVNAKDDELTAHEVSCLNKMVKQLGARTGEQDK